MTGVSHTWATRMRLCCHDQLISLWVQSNAQIHSSRSGTLLHAPTVQSSSLPAHSCQQAAQLSCSIVGQAQLPLIPYCTLAYRLLSTSAGGNKPDLVHARPAYCTLAARLLKKAASRCPRLSCSCPAHLTNSSRATSWPALRWPTPLLRFTLESVISLRIVRCHYYSSALSQAVQRHHEAQSHAGHSSPVSCDCEAWPGLTQAMRRPAWTCNPHAAVLHITDHLAITLYAGTAAAILPGKKAFAVASDAASCMSASHQ